MSEESEIKALRAEVAALKKRLTEIEDDFELMVRQYKIVLNINDTYAHAAGYDKTLAVIRRALDDYERMWAVYKKRRGIDD